MKRVYWIIGFVLLVSVIALYGIQLIKPNVEPADSSTGNVTKSVVDMSQRYEEYVKNTGLYDPKDSIMFYSCADFNGDGKEEAVIASGYKDDGVSASWITQLYFLRESGGKIEQLGENLAQEGYGIYEVKEIRLQGETEKYIYCGLTNGANLFGFEIINLTGDNPEIFCFSASGTGAGDDELKDFNNDGEYDGYIQNRWSYDVLYYPLIHTYLFQNHKFMLASTNVEIPEYPSDIKDVILQYISLNVIGAEGSPEVEKRLSELCDDQEASASDFPPDVWYDAVYKTTLEIDSKIQFDIKEGIDSAEATASFINKDKNKYTRTFVLTKVDGRWRISEINTI